MQNASPETSDQEMKSKSGFEVGQIIGRGGVGLVYKGRQLAPRRDVAIKVLFEHLAADENARRRFIDEANICAQVSDGVADAGIVRIISVVDDLFPPVEAVDGGWITRPAIVMELLNGETLDNRLEKLKKAGTPIDIGEALRIMKAVLRALNVVHSHPVDQIVHRDIKPANIFLCQPEIGRAQDTEERVVVTDFGIARVVSAATYNKTTGVVGTVAYMSPEQVQGKSVDARSDLYSCGVLLYELLSGGVPFPFDNDMAVAYAHVNTAALPLPANLPVHLREATKKALAKQPAQRFQTASEFIEALEKSKSFTPGKPLVIAAVCVALFVPLLFAAQPRTHQETHTRFGATPQLPAPPKNGTQRVLFLGKGEKQQVTELVVMRLGKELSRSVATSKTVSASRPPRVEQTFTKTIVLPKPADKVEYTNALSSGKREQKSEGSKGYKRIKVVQLLEGTRVIESKETVVEEITGKAAVYQVGQIRKVKPIVTPRPTRTPKVTKTRATITRQEPVRVVPPLNDIPALR